MTWALPRLCLFVVAAYAVNHEILKITFAWKGLG